MHPGISIRFAGTEDINIIGFLAQQIWPATYAGILEEEQLNYMLNLFYSPSSLKKQILEDNHIFLIIEDDEEPVGFASYSFISQGIYKLHKIYVLPNQQGKGLGKTIVDFIVNEIKPLNATALQLNVNRHNKAKNFYERLGFTVIKEEDINIGNNYFMNDYVMEKRI
ncbi:MAG: GNAT family N-acetyltransferase [Bacteroidetes bacterium]|nr:GNAT family N-acetyltransferase [Bacteroidota bacterium]MBS1935289.1 GNAT family N-acetyltransferase [Bacteroidota bacterium]